jgi:hypothetical protein
MPLAEDYAAGEEEQAQPAGECVFPAAPVRELRKPGRKPG